MPSKQIDLGTDWKPWVKLNEIDLYKVGTGKELTLTNDAGAYIIRLENTSLARLDGIDSLGILHIGESKHLFTRIKQFLGCLKRGYDSRETCPHMAAYRYLYLNYTKLFQNDSLVVAWKYSDDNYVLEGEMMRRYIGLFMELPPLNYKFNWSKQ